MKTGSSESSIQIAVVMLCWNDESTTREAIAKLPMLQDNIHLWVVDNGSEPPFSPENGTMSNLHIIRSHKNMGFAGGNNLGICEALTSMPSHLMLLNTDACPTGPEFNELISFCQSWPDSDIVGPALREGDKIYYGGRDPALHLNTRLTSQQEIDYVPGTVFLCRSEVFNKIGLLDEDYFFSGEIADFCQRARKAGFKMNILDKLVIDHQIRQRSTARRDTLYLYYNLRNRFLHISKHHAARRWSLFLQWIFRDIRLMIGSLLEGKIFKARAIFWALYDGLSGNFGNRNARFE